MYTSNLIKNCAIFKTTYHLITNHAILIQHFNPNAFCQVVVIAGVIVTIYVILPLAPQVEILHCDL
jgi:hypothetical protein